MRYATITVVLEKRLNKSGQKARQRNDKEDRSIPYKDWLRTIKSNGYFLDVDLIKFKSKEGEIVPVAITEITRSDSDDPVNSAYLYAIIKRYFYRDAQGKTIQKLADMLQVPAYLVLFGKQMNWLFVYSFKVKRWEQFTPEAWAEFLANL